jgi:5'-nucleotidase
MRAIVAAVVLVLLAAAPASAARIRLLAVNDLHGHLEADTPGLGGVEYLATHLRRLSNRNTLIVAAGDLVGGSPFLSAVFHDEPTIDAMNAIGLDVAGVGNHEFDEGAAELLRLQEGGCHPVDGCANETPFEGARFPYLAANVRLAGERKPMLAPYAILEVAGERIGFIGVTTRYTSFLIPPALSAELRFRDEVRTINHYARVLRRRGVRAVVALLHVGDFTARSSSIDGCRGRHGPLGDMVRRTSRQVDLFLTGHSHVAYNCVIDHRRVTSAGAFGQ